MTRPAPAGPDHYAEALRRVAEALTLLADRITEEPPGASTPAENRLMGVAEAAERLGVSEKSLRRQIARGDLPARRIGARVLLNARDLDLDPRGRPR